jgi:hypothetical protein
MTGRVLINIFEVKPGWWRRGYFRCSYRILGFGDDRFEAETHYYSTPDEREAIWRLLEPQIPR